MDQYEKLDEQVNRYIHNKMDAEELAQFELVLAATPSLKSEVEQLLQLKSNYNDDLINFKKALDEAELRYREKINKTDHSTLNFNKRKAVWLAIAATLLIVVCFYFNQNKKDIIQLAKENSLNDLSNTSMRRGDSTAVTEIQLLTGNYQAYLEKATSLLKEKPDSIERSILNVNICKSYIQLNRANDAIHFYELLTQSEKENCYLQYQVALANTISNHKAEAIRLFELVFAKRCFPLDTKADEWIKRLK